MSNYRKLVAGVVGISMILLKHFAGIELPGLADHLIEVAMAIGTWVSVWWFRNEPPDQVRGEPSDERQGEAKPGEGA
jgi:hypothetical protein